MEMSGRYEVKEVNLNHPKSLFFYIIIILYMFFEPIMEGTFKTYYSNDNMCSRTLLVPTNKTKLAHEQREKKMQMI
jgi:hypothetical protein